MRPGWRRGRPPTGWTLPWSWEATGPSTRRPTGWLVRQTALAVLPGGSTNVFARTIGMANDPIDATSQLLGALAAGSVERMGLGRANARYFLFHAGIGFDAAVVRRVEEMAPLKRYFGPALFVVATLMTWAKGYDRHEPAFSLRAGETVIDDGYFAVCLNTDPYTFLGSRPLHLAPGTSPTVTSAWSRSTGWPCGPCCLCWCTALGQGLHIGRHRHVSRYPGQHGAPVKGNGPSLTSSTGTLWPKPIKSS